MSTNLVIVAIPDENDRVWKVSSEKVPHLTLLFLGDVNEVDNVESIMQFVGHAADRSLCRFYLPVDHRGELGADQADVLFFKKNRFDFKVVKEFRSLLLKDDNIRTAYDSATQFETPNEVGEPGQAWIPHLTLGYPAAPAKPMPDDWSPDFYDVQFNKIAVWTGDSEGPEFLLKDYWDEENEANYGSMMDAPLAVAYSDLEHHGVKGMQWGVRKAENTSSSSKRAEAPGQAVKVALIGPLALLSPNLRKHTTDRTKLMVGLFGNYSILDKQVHQDLQEAGKKVKAEKADKQWDRDVGSGKAWVAINNSSAEHFNKHIDALNNKYPADRDWSHEDYANPKDPGFKKYMKDINKLTQESIEHTAKELNLQNPSGTKQVEIHSGGIPGDFRLSIKKVQHAADDNPELQIKVDYEFDAKGRVTGFTYSGSKSEMAQSDDLILEFLEHHGVKGMRWGHRKTKSGSTTLQVTSDMSAVTKRTVQEHNKMTDAEFKGKHGVSKSTYAKRVEKYGDPYMNSPLAKVGKKLGKREAGRTERTAKALGRGVKKLGTAIGDASFENRLTVDEDRAHVESQIRAKAHSAFKRDLPNIKAKPEYVKAKKLPNRLRHPLDPATKAYRKEVKAQYIKRLEDAANSITNTSGTRQYTVRERGWELPAEGGDLPTSKHFWDVTSREIKHADGSEVTWSVEVMLDDDGFVTDISDVSDVPTTDSVAQTMDLGAAWLSHHGVKGMKWGVRRERGTPGFLETRRTISENKTRVKRTPIEARVQDSIGSSGRKKTTIASKGGEDHPASDDALRVAAAQQKLKKSGLNALSNKELQDVAQRLNLETQVQVLTGKKVKKGPGAKFVEEQLKKAQNDPIQTFKKANKARKAAGPAIKTGKTLLKARRLAGVP